MYVIVGFPAGQDTYTCCPIQNFGERAGITEIELPDGYNGFTTKHCKIQAHHIFTLHSTMFLEHAGELLQPEIDELKLALMNYLELQGD